MLIVAGVILAIALAAGSLVVSTRTRRSQQDLQSRVMEALDVLDAETAAATDAKRIISEARGGKLVSVPAAAWLAKKAGENKRTTGVLLALAIMASTGVGVVAHRDPKPEPTRQEPTVGLTTAIPSTSTTTVPSSTTSPSQPAPSLPAGETTTTTTASTSTSPPPATTAPLSDELLVLASLQLGNELQASVLGQDIVLHDLTDVLAGQIGDDLAGAKELLDVVERCLTGDVPSPTEDCPPL